MSAIMLRPFTPEDFDKVLSWLPTRDALMQWSGALFRYPITRDSLRRYLDSAAKPYEREIFAAIDAAGRHVGHIEVSAIWPHLSSRLSRVLVDPAQRGQGIGGQMVKAAAGHSFKHHCVDRMDLGVAATNAGAIACYHRQGFVHVGTWKHGITVGDDHVDVYWMTLSRSGADLSSSRP